MVFILKTDPRVPEFIIYQEKIKRKKLPLDNIGL